MKNFVYSQSKSSLVHYDNSLPQVDIGSTSAYIHEGQNHFTMFTYIIKSQNLYKIGRTKDMDKRMSAIRTSNPVFELIKKIDGDYEKQLHIQFKDKRSHLEWFNLNQTDIDSIDILLPTLEIVQSPDIKYPNESNTKIPAECPCEKRLHINLFALQNAGIKLNFLEIIEKAKSTSNYNFELWADNLFMDACKSGTNNSFLKMTVTGFKNK